MRYIYLLFLLLVIQLTTGLLSTIHHIRFAILETFSYPLEPFNFTFMKLLFKGRDEVIASVNNKWIMDTNETGKRDHKQSF